VPAATETRAATGTVARKHGIRDDWGGEGEFGWCGGGEGRSGSSRSCGSAGAVEGSPEVQSDSKGQKAGRPTGRTRLGDVRTADGGEKNKGEIQR